MDIYIYTVYIHNPYIYISIMLWIFFFVCQVPELSGWVARSPFFSHAVRPRMVSGDVSATAAAETVAQLFVLQKHAYKRRFFMGEPSENGRCSTLW
jgi:hypothetical protein